MRDIDPFAVLADLGLGKAPAVEVVQGGVDAAIWRVDHAGKQYALRVLRPDQQDQARREVAAMTAAANGGVPVPDIVATATWHDRPVLLVAWSPGHSLAAALLDAVADLSRVRALGVDFGRVQAAIHALPIPAELQGEAPFWEASMATDPELAARLSGLPGRPLALIHLDYHFLNVLVAGERITAVLDWANARRGAVRRSGTDTLDHPARAAARGDRRRGGAHGAPDVRDGVAARLRAGDGADRGPRAVLLVGGRADGARAGAAGGPGGHPVVDTKLPQSGAALDEGVACTGEPPALAVRPVYERVAGAFSGPGPCAPTGAVAPVRANSSMRRRPLLDRPGRRGQTAQPVRASARRGHPCGG